MIAIGSHEIESRLGSYIVSPWKDRPSILQYALQSHWQRSHSLSMCTKEYNCFYRA